MTLWLLLARQGSTRSTGCLSRLVSYSSRYQVKVVPHQISDWRNWALAYWHSGQDSRGIPSWFRRWSITPSASWRVPHIVSGSFYRFHQAAYWCICILQLGTVSSGHFQINTTLLTKRLQVGFSDGFSQWNQLHYRCLRCIERLELCPLECIWAILYKANSGEG